MRVKVIKRIIIGVVLLIVAVAYFSSDGDDTEGTTSETTTEAEAFDEPEADIRIQARGSRCLAVASEARIYIFMTLRNYSNVAGSIDVVPIRRYSDGSTNDSVIDTMTAEVEGLERKLFRTPFDYNALEHDLLECRLRKVGSDNEVSIKVEQGF